MISIMAILSSIFFISSFHPLLAMMFLIMFTLCVTFILKILTSSKLISLMFFLMMISGLLIIFSYITSLSSNENHLINKSLLFISLLVILPLNYFLKTMSMNNFIMEMFLISLSNLNTLLVSFILMMFLFYSIFILFKSTGPLKIY